MQVGATSPAHSQTRKLAGPCPAGKSFHFPVGSTASYPSCGSRVYMRAPHAELPELPYLLKSFTIASNARKMLLVRILCSYWQVRLFEHLGPSCVMRGEQGPFPAASIYIAQHKP